MKNITHGSAPKKHPAQKLTHTLMELEQALDKWKGIEAGRSDAITEAVDRLTPLDGERDIHWLTETKKLLTKLKLQIADLDK